MKDNLNIVCPNYLCYDTLPYAADIFYHGNLAYFMPTGISQREWENVLEFPRYCSERNIALPQIIWEMHDKYFECSKQAVECSKILEPFGKRILKMNTIYARDINAISKCRKELRANPSLLECFSSSADDLNFLTRELFSHVFLEVYLEGGFSLIKEYLETNFSSQEILFELLAAVVTNRIHNIFCVKNMNYTIFNYSWYPFLIKYFHEQREREEGESTDSIDPVIHRLFTEIISPIFGRCDSRKKAEYIAQTIEKQHDAILELKNVCKEIVETSMFYKNDTLDLRDEKLKPLVTEKVIEPLSYMVSKPKNDVKKVVTDFILDSTVISGILSTTQGFSPDTIGLSAAAGAISVGLKYIINEGKNKKDKPTKLLIDGLKKNQVEYLQYENTLREIGFCQVEQFTNIE